MKKNNNKNYEGHFVSQLVLYTNAMSAERVTSRANEIFIFHDGLF